MPLLCFQLRKKVDFLGIFYCARRSGICNSRTRQLLTVDLRLQLQRQHNFVKIFEKTQKQQYYCVQFDIAVVKMHDFEFWEKKAAEIIGVEHLLYN